MADLSFPPRAVSKNLIWEWAIPICRAEAGVKVSSRRKNIPRCLPLCLWSRDAPCVNMQRATKSPASSSAFHLRSCTSSPARACFFFPLPSSALCLGEGWGGGEVKRDSCLCALCVRGDYVSDQSKHEYYKHSPSSLGCRPDITGLDSLECLDVHLAKGRSRRAAVHGWNSLWSSASTCVCVWVWVRVCVSVQCNFTTQVHQLVHVKVPR